MDLGSRTACRASRARRGVASPGIVSGCGMSFRAAGGECGVADLAFLADRPAIRYVNVLRERDDCLVAGPLHRVEFAKHGSGPGLRAVPQVPLSRPRRVCLMTSASPGTWGPVRPRLAVPPPGSEAARSLHPVLRPGAVCLRVFLRLQPYAPPRPWIAAAVTGGDPVLTAASRVNGVTGTVSCPSAR